MEIHRATKDLHRALSIESTGEKVHGPCGCCGNVTRTVWGFAHRQSGDTLASYFVSWTVDSPHHDVYVDMIIGRWGEGVSIADRKAVSLAYRAAEGSFMVIDAGERPLATSPLVCAALAPEQVVDLPLSFIAYAIVDAIWLQDARIAEVLGWSSRP
jgi:hypothetical protein